MNDRPPSPSDAGMERLLLARICASGLSRAPKEPIEVEGIDWQQFSSLARRHRIVPVVWRNLALPPALVIPPDVMREVREAHKRNALSAMQSAAHLMKIAGALAAAGIPALPLKGVCLAALHYGDIAARHAGDIDLLVAPAHLARANAIMRELGYLRISNETHAVMQEPFDEDMYFRLHSMHLSTDGAIVELHFQLHFNPAVLTVDVAEIVGLGIRARFGKASLAAMPNDLQFIFLATHGARHEWERLQWIYDIAIMADHASDAEIREWLATAEKHRLTNPAIQALVLAQRIFGISLPAEVARAHRKSLRIRYMVRRAERAMLRGPERAPDQLGPAFKLSRRLYRMCITSRPDYLWHELRNGFGALVARLTKPTAVRV